MKKSLKAILLGAVVMTLLCVSAMAADPATTEGFHSIEDTYDSVEIVVQEADKAPATKAEANVDGKDVEDFYADGVRMKVTYTGELEAGDQYLVMLVEGDELPTVADIICYIDQKAESDAQDGKIVFDVFPKLPTASKNLTLYITSNAIDFDQIKIPVSYAGQPYVLGDVDANGSVELNDAVQALRIYAELYDATEKEMLAADVTQNGSVELFDAVGILQYYAGLIDSWDEL